MIRYRKIALTILVLNIGCSNASSFKSSTGGSESRKIDSKTIENGSDAASNREGSEVDTSTNQNGIDISTEPFPPNIVNKTTTLALMVKNIECAACHMSVNGDIVTLGDLDYPRRDTLKGQVSTINGRWLIEGEVVLGGSSRKREEGGLTKYLEQPVEPGIYVKDYEINSADRALPVDVDGDGQRDWPRFEKFTGTGSININTGSNYAVNLSGNYSGNVTLVGTKDQPIRIQGDVYIEGNVIIAGYYSGVGTIYTSGYIYIPRNLLALNSGFPMPVDRVAAISHAKKVFQSTDGLALASKESIVFGDYKVLAQAEKVIYGGQEGSPAYGKFIPVPHLSDSEFMSLLQTSTGCSTGEQVTGNVTRVDAYLFADEEITGLVDDESYIINGGVITPFLSIVGAVDKSCNSNNEINYDYRIIAGMPLLSKLQKYFTTITGG